jgi:hypothetical protein
MSTPPPLLSRHIVKIVQSLKREILLLMSLNTEFFYMLYNRIVQDVGILWDNTFLSNKVTMFVATSFKFNFKNVFVANCLCDMNFKMSRPINYLV